MNFAIRCNINKSDRINRIIIGALIFLASWFHFSDLFFSCLAVVLMVEGIIGWCSIPFFLERIKLFLKSK